MDISKILPLLMNKSGGKNEQAQAIMKLAQGEKPDMSDVMNMAMKSRATPRPAGLGAIAEIAPCEIMGKLAKFFLS